MALWAILTWPQLGLLAVLAIVVPWLLFTEFSYFGRGPIRWLYNLMAGGYEKKWSRTEYASPEITQRLFLAPLRQALEHDGESARLLDLGCGSGRLSLLVLEQPWFEGRIDAVDLAEGMLARFQARSKELPESSRRRVSMQRADLMRWSPPPEARYNALLLMELTEFLSNWPGLLARMAPHLRPGALVMLTRVPAPLGWIYLGRRQSPRSMERALADAGFTDVRLERWMRRYDVVTARYSGPAAGSPQEVATTGVTTGTTT